MPVRDRRRAGRATSPPAMPTRRWPSETARLEGEARPRRDVRRQLALAERESERLRELRRRHGAASRALAKRSEQRLLARQPPRRRAVLRRRRASTARGTAPRPAPATRGSGPRTRRSPATPLPSSSRSSSSACRVMTSVRLGPPARVAQHRQQLAQHVGRGQVAERLDVAGVPGRLQAKEARSRRLEHPAARSSAGRRFGGCGAGSRLRRAQPRRCAAGRGSGAERRGARCQRQAARSEEEARRRSTTAAAPREVVGAARREQRQSAASMPSHGATPPRTMPPAPAAAAGALPSRSGTPRPSESGARQRRGEAHRRPAAAQHLIPTCRATTPALRLWTSTWPKPAVFIIAFSVAWSGWTRIDSAR